VTGDVAALGLAALIAVLLAKEIGVPIPIPSDLLMIGAGVQAATGAFGLAELAAGVLLAVAVGASIQFLLVRRYGRRAVYRLGGLVGLTPERLDALAERLRRRGAVGVFVGLNVPAARAGVVPAAGLAGLSYLAFAPAAIAGTATFHAWHVALGYLVGPAAIAALGALNLGVVAALAALAALGAAGWVALRLRGRRVAEAPARQWAEAACPACLASALLADRSML
jgi:membrane protein DedA with SNARE-associated domain